MTSFAGIHPPAASLTMLLWNLLHNPTCLERAETEIDHNMPLMTPDRGPYNLADVERSLPWLRSCIKESFRFTPVFTMPLTRRIVDNETLLNGKLIAKGVRIACEMFYYTEPSRHADEYTSYRPM
jgi:cytochrome P450